MLHSVALVKALSGKYAMQTVTKQQDTSSTRIISSISIMFNLSWALVIEQQQKSSEINFKLK